MSQAINLLYSMRLCSPPLLLLAERRLAVDACVGLFLTTCRVVAASED
jgi:hypothetical protein